VTTSPSRPRVRLPAGTTTALGGPRGRRAVPAPSSGVARLAPAVLLLGLPLAVAALRQTACTGPGWEGRTPIWRQCASSLVESVPVDGLGAGPVAYLTGSVPVDVPPVTGLVTSVLARLSPGGALSEQRWFLLWWMVLAAVLLAAMVVAVGTVRRHPLADPVALALSPVVALTVLLSPALLPLAFAVVALWAWSRDRVRLAGVLAGLALLGGAASAAVLLAMVLVPGPGGRRAVRELLFAAGLTVLFVTAPVAALDARNLTRPVTAWWTDGAGPGSPWLLPSLAGHPVSAGHVAVISALGAVAALALGVVMTRRTPRPPVADVALLVLVVLALTATALPVAAGLWLVPFVALTGIRWRDHLLWAGAEWVHAVAWFTYVDGLTDPAKGLPAGWYAAALGLRLLAVGRLGWVVWARTLWPAAPVPVFTPTAPPTPVPGARATADDRGDGSGEVADSVDAGGGRYA
jgi:hypothetical protein